MVEAHTLFVTKFITFHTYFTIAVVVAAMISYAKEKISLELTSLFVIAAFMLFFHFFPLLDAGGNPVLTSDALLLGFANPALITIVSLLIIGQAIIQSNALNVIPNMIMKISHSNAFVAIFFSLVVVAIISAFMNNTPVVVIFIPILAEITRNLGISQSKVMIPLSYAAILGGMITLIGSSTNLLIAGSVENLGLPPLTFFEFAVPGSIMAAVGMVYILGILPKILPDRESAKFSFQDDRDFISQIYIAKDSDLDEKQMVEGHLPGFSNITVRVIERSGANFLPPFQDAMILKDGDVLTISGTRNALAELVHKKPKIFLKNKHLKESHHDGDHEHHIDIEEANIAELVISPGSRYVGETIKNAEFYTQYKCPVIGIQRKGSLVKTKMTQLRLVAGDVLLILGDISKILEIRNNKDIILTKWSAQQVNSIARVVKTLVIFSAVILTSAFNIVPISISSFTAAGLLIFLNCISMKQAAKSVDRKVVLLIVASIAMGIAMQATGAAALLAENMVKSLEGFSTIQMVGLFFLFIAIITNILSNAATAVLFTPIGVNLAIKLGVDPKIFIYALIFACNCSFVTPIGYQTNLMVMTPGKYKFVDFVKAGIPLALLLCYVYTIVVRYYFGIS